MRTSSQLLSVLGAALISTLAISAQAATGTYYDPTNAASSKEGKTIGYELYKTIGCPGKQLLDAGCKETKPVDSDGDGIADTMDKCPTVPAPGTKDGCPPDSDGDGIYDSKDKCPTVPAPGTKDGCPVDSDGDGIADTMDKCPTVPAPGTKDGCPLDSDGDGITDNMDKCPTVYAKTDDGCPVAEMPKPAPAPKKLVLEGVNFDNDKATLRSDAYPVLDQAAATLQEWGNVNVEVAGHTDSRSSDAYNMSLSQRRADAVRNYLISKGIDADRLSAKGYGESQPVADNNTEEGRFKNRRVELVPQH